MADQHQLTDEQWRSIEDALFAGRKIEAIKHYRDFTNCDLKEAKESVEAYEKQLRQTMPDKFTAVASNKSGCSVKVAMLMFLILIGVTGILFCVLVN